MSVPVTIFAAFHFGQTLQSLWAGVHSFRAINVLLDYEDVSERAAQYSKVAAEQLSKTRTTQAAGAISIFFSALSAAGLMVFPFFPHHHFHTSYLKMSIYLANIAIPYLARIYMADFWEEKTKVPLMEGYNEAIVQTRVVWKYLQRISFSWIAVGVLEIVFHAFGAETD